MVAGPTIDRQLLRDLFAHCIEASQILGVDAEFRKQDSVIKGRFAPAMLAYAMAEGLLAQATLQHTGLAFLNMELNVHNPVFAGDTIHVEVEVIEARVSRSRPDRGLVRTRNEVTKQDGTKVLTYTPLRMVKCRKDAQP